MLLLVPLAHAQIDKVEINANIGVDGSVQHAVAYYFSQPLNETSINYSISQSVTGISASDGTQDLNYRVNGNNIEIFLKNSTSLLTITYTADNVVYHSDNINHFFTEFTFNETVGELVVIVALPQGYTLSNNFYTPAEGNVITDGKKIIVKWTQPDALGRYIFAVNFMNPNERADPFLLTTIVLVIAIVVGTYYGYGHFHRKVQDAFFKGFRDDEKKTMEFLQQKHVALQSDLQKEFGFSRAKATRIIMKLEEHKLVRKQRYGRTNKLHWLK
jgi:uncharacterized membrane protein